MISFGKNLILLFLICDCNTDDKLTDGDGKKFLKTCIEPYLYKVITCSVFKI